ncbi:MAG: hypothetical protein FWJ93_12830 [Micromonosporaceae bacterium]
MRFPRPPVAVAALLLLTVTACGPDDPGPAPTDTGPPPTTAAGPASPAPDPTPTPTGPTVTTFRTAYDWGVPAPLVQVTNPDLSQLPYLVEIHAADHPGDPPGYSRISFYFRGGFPSYEFGYVGQVEAEGTGDPIRLPGNGTVRIRFTGARAHDDAGRSTITTAPRPDLGMPNLRGYGFAGDFEGHVTYGLGIQVAPGSDQVLAMRVLELTRTDGIHVVAFDIRHG